MSSQQKIDSARANGAKSRGPKTAAGRKKSAMNAVTHGLYAQGVVLPNEPHEQHREMLPAYLQHFQPQGPAEFDLVEEMVAAKWRQRRLWAIETDLLEDEMHHQKAKFDEEGTGYTPITPLSFAYAALSASTALPFLTRNESRLERAYSRALKNLLELQRLRKAAQPTTNENMQERTQIPTTNQPPPPAAKPQKLFPPPTTHHPQPARPEPEPAARARASLDVTSPNSLA